MIKILITSGKGGVGKTTICANVGAMLSIKEKNIVLVDGDAGLRNLDIALGLSSKIVFDAVDVINDNCEVEDAAISHPLFPNLHLITAPQEKRYSKLDIKKLCDILDNSYDICMIDSPAGIDDGFNACANVSDMAIVVVTPDVASVRDALATIEKLNEYNIDRIYAIVNRARSNMARRGKCMRVADVEEIINCRVIGSIDESKHIVQAGNLGIIYNKGRSKDLYEKVSNEILRIVNKEE